MIFKRMLQLTTDGDRDSLSIVWPTAASPVTFAPPIEAVENAETFMLVFDIRGSTPEEITVRIDEGMVTLERIAPRARRTFSFTKPVDPARAEHEYTSTTLTVRVTKREISTSRQIIVRR